MTILPVSVEAIARRAVMPNGKSGEQRERKETDGR